MDGEDTLLLDGRLLGFWGYRSLERLFSGIPPVANHRLLAASALRQGLAKPIISGVFPHAFWRELDTPVRHFLLDAAEIVGSEKCRPVYPDTPSVEVMEKVCDCLANEDNPKPLDARSHQSSLARPEIDVALKQLGISEAVRAAIAQFSDREQRGEWVWDYRSAVLELRDSLVGMDVELSLSLENTLSLYPLHKRVLGLIEYILVPKLHEQGFQGSASQAWTDRFFFETPTDKARNKITGPLNGHSEKAKLGHLATLETEGNWLLYAAQHEADNSTSPIDLGALLDGIMSRMSDAAEVAGLSVNLQPQTPQAHAQQLAALADRSKNESACMALYLGKLALMLRNAVEHGIDRVVNEGLLVETPGYWKKERGQKSNRIPVFKWLHETANLKCCCWRSRASLPKKLPDAAHAFVLTPASLHRCLTLISLVLQAAKAHLQI